MNKWILLSSLCLLLFDSHTIHSREFFDTILHLNLGVAYGEPHGGIIDREESYKVKDNTPDHHLNSLGITLDITPFRTYVFGRGSHAFKFGLRGNYKFHFVEQKRKKISNPADTESLIRYDTLMLGPVMHYSPRAALSPVSGGYASGYGFTFYVLYGNITRGEIRNFPSRRKTDNPPPEDRYPEYITTVFDGFQIDAGVGGAVSVGYVNLGLNLYYTYVRYRLGEWVYDGLSRTGDMGHFAAEIYIGIPVEWNSVAGIFQE